MIRLLPIPDKRRPQRPTVRTVCFSTQGTFAAWAFDTRGQRVGCPRSGFRAADGPSHAGTIDVEAIIEATTPATRFVRLTTQGRAHTAKPDACTEREEVTETDFLRAAEDHARDR